MKRTALAALLCALFYSSAYLAAQEKPKTEEKTDTKRDLTPLRVQVLIAEYDGEKKISSLPYTLLVNAEGTRGQKASIRMGLRVPIATSASQYQYQDVGTNLDAWAGKVEDGRFTLHLGVERSSTYSSSAKQPASTGGNEVLANQPVIQQFRTELDVLIRDGQTIQTTLATDPVSGRVTKVELAVSVVK